MADNSNVGRTVGIVLGVTAVLGLGLYLILRPKTASAATPSYNPNLSANQVAQLQAQIAQMQLDAQRYKDTVTADQKAANQAQLNSLLLQLGGKVASKGLDYWIGGWGGGNTQDTYLDTSLADTAPSYVTDSTWVDTKYGYLTPWG